MWTIPFLVAFAASFGSSAAAGPVVASTTSGKLHGSRDRGAGVVSFKGVRFAHPPVRWEAPVAFTSTAAQNATAFGAACVQQFTSALSEQLFNNPDDPPIESEDCLFLNVWAPEYAQKSSKKLPVALWIYGGSLSFGTASLPIYDGTSFAKDQNIIFVSFNYRTNVFGFPKSPDLRLTGNNLGFMDQELAIQWVQDNIAQLGGDPDKVTIMGESAGALSVSVAIARRAPGTAPFRAAVMFSGAQPSTIPTPSFDVFNAFASAVGCGQSPGDARMACLRQLPTEAIRNYTNQPTSGTFGPVVDNITTFSDPLQRIRSGKTANVPFIIGHMQDDGTLFTLGITDLTAFLNAISGGLVTADQVRPLYPGLSDEEIIWASYRDSTFLCIAHLWAGAAVGAGVSDVYRYAYGAVFDDLQKFPNAGAWHSSELFEVFGTYNRTTATPDEAELSRTMQTTIANFVKDPTTSPAPNWIKYVPGNTTSTLAKLSYTGNVHMNDVVDAVQSDSVDAPCALWDQFLDFRV
ncbi:Carboxylic ester hydrolase [Mycena kentingensis (nom. inval.)]|nr:Carboxylic ester hydrolase [Mycena kentingensis (nom. inval.)]